MHGKCNFSLCAVFKWSLMFVRKKLCKKRKKQRCKEKIRNGSSKRASERTLKKNVWCLSQFKTLCFGLRGNGKAGDLWYLMVLTPFI